MFKKLIGIVTVFGYLLQACGAPDPNANGSNGSTAADSVASKGFAEPAKAATPNLNRYSTEELARGMFFGDGPVAEAIPTVRNNFLLTDKVKDPQALAQQREAIAVDDQRRIRSLQDAAPGICIGRAEGVVERREGRRLHRSGGRRHGLRGHASGA